MLSHTKEAYFATQNPHDKTAVMRFEVRKLEYEFYVSHLPELDADFPLACIDVTTSTGLGSKKLEHIFCAIYRLDELPKLKELQETYFLLELDHLIAIDQVLDKLGAITEDNLAMIDAALIRFLTPTQPNQQFPVPSQLRRKLRDICKTIDDRVSFRPRKDDEQPYFFSYVDSKEGFFELFTDPKAGLAIAANVQQAAEQNNISQAQACVKLLTGELAPAPKVVLHAYKATDVPDAPTFIQGHGWFNLDLEADTVRDLTEPCEPSDSYKAPEIMRKRVEGRDGTCRYPGCDRPAWKTQLDHRTNYSEGGQTHPNNLVALCQHHHNIKTDKRVKYLLDPDTGQVWWLFENGTWVTTEASGPLSPAAKRWVQSAAQFIAAKRARAHEEALAAANSAEVTGIGNSAEVAGTAGDASVVVNNDDDDPPPF